MNILKTTLQDAFLIETRVFEDHRGFFTESYAKKDFENKGLFYNFIQDNHSLSKKAGVLRGLHFQKGKAAQAKLVRVVTGVVYDVIVDLRKKSPTYGHWEGFILSESNHRQLLVPKGFAHGFCTLTPDVHFLYKCDAPYNQKEEGGILFSDETLNIQWPFNLKQAITSEKDLVYPTFKVFEKENTFVYEKEGKNK